MRSLPTDRVGAHSRDTKTSELTWRVIRDAPLEGARNMALDHALATSLPDGEAVLRLYSWLWPTISFGRNEPARGRYSEALARVRGLEYVRRPTGGRAVVHDEELTYAVIAPLRAMGGARIAYHRINRALASALAEIGADVTVSDEPTVSPLDAGPCFQSPAAGEVVAGGRKLVGSAQARIGRMLLQHGSILLSGDQAVLEELRVDVGDVGSAPAPVLAPAASGTTVGSPVSLGSLVGAVTLDAVADGVAEAMAHELGGRWPLGLAGSTYTPAELREADRMEEERYRTQGWTWRR